MPDLDELSRLLSADEQWIETTGERTVSYKWLARCRILLAQAREAKRLRAALVEAKDWIDPRTSPVPLTSMQMIARIDAALTPEQP